MRKQTSRNQSDHIHVSLVSSLTDIKAIGFRSFVGLLLKICAFDLTVIIYIMDQELYCSSVYAIRNGAMPLASFSVMRSDR